MTPSRQEKIAVTHVIFDGDAVAIKTSIPDVRRELNAMFSKMLRDPSGDPIDTVVIRSKSNRRYAVQKRNGQLVTCNSIDTTVRTVRDDIMHGFIEARPDLFWFHAGGVVLENAAVMMPGSWGKGKSTMTATLCANGCAYLSDDIIPLDPKSGHVLPFPKTPEVRQPAGRQLVRDEAAELSKLRIPIRSEDISWQHQPLGSIVFPEFQHDRPFGLTTCRPSDAVLRLVDTCINFGAKGSDAIEYFCSLVERHPVSILHHGGRIPDLESQREAHETDVFAVSAEHGPLSQST